MNSDDIFHPRLLFAVVILSIAAIFAIAAAQWVDAPGGRPTRGVDSTARRKMSSFEELEDEDEIRAETGFEQSH